MDAAIGEAFDFDGWRGLANRDPAEFDRRRLAAIEAVVNGSCNANALRTLQWRIDAERRRAPTSLKACLKISAMMWDSMLDLERALDGREAARPRPKGDSATILRFRRGGR